MFRFSHGCTTSALRSVNINYACVSNLRVGTAVLSLHWQGDVTERWKVTLNSLFYVLLDDTNWRWHKTVENAVLGCFPSHEVFDIVNYVKYWKTKNFHTNHDAQIHGIQSLLLCVCFLPLFHSRSGFGLGAVPTLNVRLPGGELHIGLDTKAMIISNCSQPLIATLRRSSV